jgi:hypothetical protein
MFRCDPDGVFWSETRRGGAVFDAELGINVLEMFADRRRLNTQDGGNFAVRFGAAEPEQHFIFSRGQALARRDRPSRLV